MRGTALLCLDAMYDISRRMPCRHHMFVSGMQHDPQSFFCLQGCVLLRTGDIQQSGQAHGAGAPEARAGCDASNMQAFGAAHCAGVKMQRYL